MSRFLASLTGRLGDSLTRANRRREFQEALFDAVKDGKLTGEEMEELSRFRDEYGFTEEDIRPVRVQLYLIAFQSVAEDENVTEDEWNEMGKIQTFLGIKDTEVGATKKELLRLHILNEIDHGHLPVVRPRGLALPDGERAHWVEKAELQSKTTEQAGTLVLTNKRLIFRSKKPLALRLPKILDVRGDGLQLRVAEAGDKPPKVFRLNDRATRGILRSALSRAMTLYGT